MDIEKILTEAIRLGGQDIITEATKTNIHVKDFNKIVTSLDDFNSKINKSKIFKPQGIIVQWTASRNKPGTFNSGIATSSEFLTFCKAIQLGFGRKIASLAPNKKNEWTTLHSYLRKRGIQEEYFQKAEETVTQYMSGKFSEFDLVILPLIDKRDKRSDWLNVYNVCIGAKCTVDTGFVLFPPHEVCTWLQFEYYKKRDWNARAFINDIPETIIAKSK